MKDKRFHMRCDQQFLDDLDKLSEAMGVSKSQFVEIAIGIFPSLIEMQQKLDNLIKNAKDSL